MNGIPQELKQLNQWVIWGLDKGKPKMPFNPATMKPAKAGQPDTWNSYWEAINRAKCGQALGVGFEFNDNGYIGVDLDTVLDPNTGQLSADAAEIVKLLDSYTEISPSGYGVHLFVKANIKLEQNKKKLPGETLIVRYDDNGKRKEHEIEMYSEGRYFTVTGNVYGDIKPIAERTEQLQAVYDKYLKPRPAEPPRPLQQPAATYSGKTDEEYLNIGIEKDQVLGALWNGDRSNGNESADDIALMNKLAYWCNGNETLMSGAFLSSPHAHQKDTEHAKKLQRADYIARTIKKAVKDANTTARERDAAYTPPIRATAAQDFKPVRPQDPKHEVRPTSSGYAPVEAKSKLKVRRMSEIEAKGIEYLIEPYFPAGTFSIIAGESGSTKTWLSLYLATIIANGSEFITDTPFASKREPRVVIYQSKENDYETVIRPRLDTLGANLDNIIMIDDRDEDESGMPLTLTDGRLEAAIKEFNPALIILDPLQSYLGDDVDMHRANEVRPVLDKIIDMGSRYNCSFVIIMHLSKMTTVGALDRILGTVDFRAAARSVVIVGSDPEDQKRRVFAHAKFNNGEYGRSIAYHIDGAKGVVIEGFCDFDEDEIVRRKKGERDRPSVSLDEAKEFLIGMMGEKGFAHTRDIQREAEARGIKRQTLYNAKSELLIDSHQIGKGQNHVSWWTMPNVTKEQTQKQVISVPLTLIKPTEEEPPVNDSNDSKEHE